MRVPFRDQGGTRFRIFPQAPFLHPGRLPQTVSIATPPGGIGPGPSDDRLYVINPIGKRAPYGVGLGPYGHLFLDLPPWRGPTEPPVLPDPGGHFDHIPPDSPLFAEAHVFAIIRFVLDVWERYRGRPIRWHFARDLPQLEVVMLPAFNNAHVGYGFMEVGAHRNPDGSTVPFALNFDVIAHELGHLIIYGTIGVPDPGAAGGEYFGFHEAAADMTAMLASLHFDAVVRDVLDETRGNLYAFNELNRFAELSTTSQIRLASNSVKLSDFSAGWTDEHALSQPLAGALFDILVDIFQENLVERGVIPRRIAEWADLVERHPEFEPVIQSVFDTVYPREPEAFFEALLDARDYLGIALAQTWDRLSADDLAYVEVGATLIDVDAMLSGGRHYDAIVESFLWRDIGTATVGPRLRPPDGTSHVCSARTITPADARVLPRMTYRERFLVRRGTGLHHFGG